MPYEVLIVDSQAMPRQLFQIIVGSSQNYRVAGTLDSASAAEVLCASGRIDLVLMDVATSGGLGGMDAALRIRTTCPDIKVILVSSLPDPVLLARAREAGADSFWYKEAQDSPLLQVMDRTMAGERVFPRQAPAVAIGAALSTDLTVRELDVLRQVAAARSDKEITSRLHISYGTVRVHLNNLLKKTGCANRTELAILAATSGLVAPRHQMP